MLDTLEIDGLRFRVTVEHDTHHGAPWDEEDGHGPVSDWRGENYAGYVEKRAGELVLYRDRRSYRLYDFAEACRIARRDGWGFLPGELKTERLALGDWAAWVVPKSFADRNKTPRMFEATGEDINAAIRKVYALHRATMTARQYAAGAAMVDFERLRAWCEDQWHYVGVIVEMIDDEGEPISGQESLWGIESDSDDYLQEVAIELATELASQHARALALAIAADRPDLSPAYGESA